jgi:4-amino-4-deoxy-L-arabinose transferase-like glycosyltransferase
LISRHVRLPASLLILVYGTYWVSVTFIASFYGYFIAAVASLIAVACYVAVRAEQSRQVLMGVALGASLALAMWFRQIEGFLVGICLLGHALVVSPGAFWRQRWRGMSAAAVSVFVVFVVPWVIDTNSRFGSVSERIRGGAGQDFERGIFNHIGDYWDVLTGHSAHPNGQHLGSQWC